MMTAADRRKLNKDAGFSLLELLIAVVILAIIVIPLLNLFFSSNKLNIRSRQTLRATTAAQDIMEGLKAYNIEEIKAQFADPASGFYVIDSRLIKGGMAEETSLEVDPSGNPAKGLYVFSMRDVTMQGSQFDAKIVVDGRGYMTGTLTHDNEFNDAALADARSIDKENGTFVESERIRQAVLTSVFKDSDMKDAVVDKLRAAGLSDLEIDDKIDAVCFKNAAAFFDQISRTITIDLSVSAEVDKDGRPKVDMEITQVYDFTYKDLSGTDVVVHTSGDMGSGIVVNGQPCGSIARMVETDPATGADVEKINVNLFYYPLYGASSPDKIIINNGSGADLNLLIAKQRHEVTDSVTGLPDPSDPEYLTDAQLMAAEQTYHADIEIKDGHGASLASDKFILKTNLGLNLVGEKYLAGAMIELPAQLTVNGTHMDLSGSSNMNIFTLDGVRSKMGKPAAPGEATELIYDVEVGVYEAGAAASGFPDDMRMVVIGGSTTN